MKGRAVDRERAALARVSFTPAQLPPLLLLLPLRSHCHSVRANLVVNNDGLFITVCPSHPIKVNKITASFCY